MNLRANIVAATDWLLPAIVVALVLGSALCFGGVVWWYRPVAVVCTVLLVGAQLAQHLARGRLRMLKSPLTLLGAAGLGLAILQLAPLPAGLARRVSPAAHELYSCGVFPALVRADLPTAPEINEAPIRSPATLDRAATLRWLVTALVCLGIFWSVSHFADRLSRLYLVWGCVVGAFFLNGAFAVVQLVGLADGMFGYIQPGRAPIWAPSSDSLLEAPTFAALRGLDGAAASAPSPMQTIALVPEHPFQFGTLLGGSGALLALGSLALPLATAVLLHIVAPRGSRESLGSRLSHSGQGSLVVLLVIMLPMSAFLVGLLAGPIFCLPFAISFLLVSLPAAKAAGWWSAGVTAILGTSLALGAVLAAVGPALFGDSPVVTPVSWESTRQLWNDSLSILQSFPLMGTGLGSFGAIEPYAKSVDSTSTVAMSSLLQCGVEAGFAGLTLVALAGLWSLCKLPSSLRQVGSADRTLAYGLIGAAVGFGLWSLVQWTVELPAVAIAASASCGLWNRWLAGGTDLFVQRG